MSTLKYVLTHREMLETTKIFTFPRQNIENPLTALEETKIGLVSGKIHET